MAGSCIETSSTPDWVVKLERKREEVFRGRKLGHESGAGAPCNVCGSACPGLDLHFWRKLCRNCRCRKDQHECPDDDLSGWAQFEVLGQQRSQPAVIKISKTDEKPVKVDWVPPDVTPDIATDYMNDLGTQNVPVEGSEAAAKRRQQLEYQVPPHDLDPTLCHNLTENETAQLQKYVEKIKENCVGQGNVVRVAGGSPPRISYIENVFPEKVNETIVKDRMLTYVLKSDAIKGVLQTPAAILKGDTIVSECRPMTPDFMESPLLSDKNRYKLKQMKLNSQALQSGVLNGATKDNLLGPLENFRREYRQNDRFKTDVDNFVNSLGSEFLDSYQLDEDTVRLTDKEGKEVDDFQSPLPIRPFAQMKLSKMAQQETPARKLKFGKSTDIPIYALASYDKILPGIMENPLVESAAAGTDLIVNTAPLFPDFQPGQLRPATEQKLLNLGLNAATVRSGVVSGPQYDDLFRELRKKKVRFGEDTILGPMEAFRDEYLDNEAFRDDVNNFTLATANQMMDNPNTNPFLLGIIPSQSSDSGFESIALTPSNSQESPGEETDVRMSVMKCKQCFLDIYAGDVAVKAERAGKSVAWHPKCFVCHKCQELLADLVYFFHGGNVYCARDLAIILDIPRCSACDELIFMKEYTVAEGSTFHIKHFCCFQCDKPLAGHKYVPDDTTGQPLCLACFDEFHAEKCSRCHKSIGPAEQGVSWGKVHWHGTCFACAGVSCGKSLIGQRFCVKNDIPFCSPACVKSINF
uniref:Putative focal adhesion protein pinch-1 n=1 Tax=Lutzomyia longipalpis TaxID=7200 RepID=A0A1B0FV48_LUTLO